MTRLESLKVDFIFILNIFDPQQIPASLSLSLTFIGVNFKLFPLLACLRNAFKFVEALIYEQSGLFNT